MMAAESHGSGIAVHLRQNPSATAGAISHSAPETRRTFASVYDRRRNNFDCLRFVLATLVIWSHCFPLSGRAKDWFFTMSDQTDGGSLAVDGFFVLSGFLITQSWFGAPDLAVFTRKRLLRIVPALILALTFGALVVGPFASERSLPEYLKSSGTWLHFLGVAINRFLMIPGTFTTNPLPEMVNAPLWSLRFELFCYALVALVGWAFQRSWSLVVSLTFLASSALVLLHPPVGLIAMAMGRLISCFSAGMLYYTFRDRIPYHPLVAAGAAAILLATFTTMGFRMVFPIVGGYFLLFIAFAKNLGLARFARHGDFSYGLYVFAYPIQQTLIYRLGTDISVTWFFVLAFIPTLALAALSWHLIEAPALAHKPRARVTAT